MGAFLLLCVLVAHPVASMVIQQNEATRAAANPIRKVVTLLQTMQKKITEEGEKEKELYEKFMCYCKTSGGQLKEDVSTGDAKVPALSSDIKAAVEQKTQAQDALKTAQSDRTAAKNTIAESTSIRKKEAAAFAAEKEEMTSNIDALKTSVDAISKGMAGSFLQTKAAQVLKMLVASKQIDVMDDDRQQVLSFLGSSEGSGYVPQSTQVVGILKGMTDDMEKTLAETTATETAAIKTYEELMAAKKKEVDVLTKTIETKTRKVGELGVAIVQMKNDLSDTEEALMADKEFLANLQKGCDTKTTEWEERSKTRADELLALAETIKVLNDDDALELFKKTLPSAAASLVQMDVSRHNMRMRALATLNATYTAKHPDRARLDLLMLALRGKKIGFEKVVAMVDDMVSTLKTEQADDDHKKEYCLAQFDIADDKKKALERSVSDEETAIANAKDGIATLKEEIAALEAGIKALDKSVMEATEDRKAEHEEFSELMASDTAAKELLQFAKNRLNKFYNPKLYKPPPKKELARDDRIMENMMGAALLQVTARGHREAPPPPPETFGAYTKKSAENQGVLAMIDLLMKDLDKEMTEAKTEEKDAQADYETAMKDSAAKRTKDSKTLSEKEGTKADLESDLEDHNDAKAAAAKELGSTMKYISTLHGDCDWLLKYFEVRKEARTSEIDALGKAKAVLSGADYTLMQTATRGFLRGSF